MLHSYTPFRESTVFVSISLCGVDYGGAAVIVGPAFAHRAGVFLPGTPLLRQRF